MNLPNFFGELKRRNVYKVARTNFLLSELRRSGLNRLEHSRIFDR